MDTLTSSNHGSGLHQSLEEAAHEKALELYKEPMDWVVSFSSATNLAMWSWAKLLTSLDLSYAGPF